MPVAAGASVPLVRHLVTAEYVHGENGLAGVEFPAPKLKPVAESATEIICRLVRSSPGEITIVAIGPLTNIATVLRSDPEIARMIPAIRIMGGGLVHGNITPAAEFNLYVDPEAARIVFDAGIPLTMVGLDVTEKVLVNDSHIRQLQAAQNPVSQAAAKILKATLDHVRHSNNITYVAMHDPLTVASLIDPSLLTFTDYHVDIETEGEFTSGMSVGLGSRSGSRLGADGPRRSAGTRARHVVPRERQCRHRSSAAALFRFADPAPRRNRLSVREFTTFIWHSQAPQAQKNLGLCAPYFASGIGRLATDTHVPFCSTHLRCCLSVAAFWMSDNALAITPCEF